MALELPDGESTRELIKCVVVGDSGVGKTKLICAQALGQGILPEKKHSLLQCSHGSHKPSVFAIDKYYKSPEIQARSNMIVDRVPVALRLWDTFGDHQKDRRFAYQHSHVVALCFAINCPPSLESVNNFWYKEIKQSCPRVPIILVGTKSDCRLEMASESPKPFKHSSLSRQIRECSVITPEMGRRVAVEIGASYYECSVRWMVGLEDVFHNVIRAALCCQRARRLLSKQLRKVSRPQLQVPYLPPRPQTPEIVIPPSTYHTELGSLLSNGLYYDLVFSVQGMVIRAHHAILVAASCFPFIFGENSLGGEGELLMSSHGCVDVHCPSEAIAVQNIIEEERSITIIDILNDSISFQVLYGLLELLYTGSISAVISAPDIIEAAKLLNVKLLDNIHGPVNLASNTLSLWRQTMIRNMRQLFFKKELFSDICFEIEGFSIPAHKAILVSRCEMMAAMFEEGHFEEANRQMVKLTDMNMEPFLAVLEYLYTDEVSKDYQGSKVAAMALANFFCLPRLVALYEELIIEEITHEALNSRNVIEYLLAAEMHNASQLKSWGEHYVIVHYEKFLEQNKGALNMLPLKTSQALAARRWPPEWYLVEDEWYQKTVKEKEALHKLQEKRRWYQALHGRAHSSRSPTKTN